MIRFGDIPLDAVLFDLDGTLVHSHIDFALMRTEMVRLAEQAGVPKSKLDDKEVLEMVQAAAEAVDTDSGNDLRRRMWRRLENIERDGCADAQAVPGAAEMLRNLRGCGVRSAIVTRNCRAVAAPMTAALGLDADTLLTRDDVARCKPDPAHLRDALAEIGCHAGRSLMVGDHWLDVQVGQQCGCAATLGVLGDREPAYFDACRPTYMARDLEEALALFHFDGSCSPSAS